MKKLGAALCGLILACTANGLPAADCDANMQTTLHMLTRLTDMALTSQTLSLDELRAGFATTPFTDPMASKTPLSDNANLQTGFRRALARVRPQDTTYLRERLNAVLSQATIHQEVSETAHAATRTLFVPRIISKTGDNQSLGLDARVATWHHDEQGRLQWVGFNRDTKILTALSPDNATTPAWSEPVIQDGTDTSPLIIAGQSLPGGEYVVAFSAWIHPPQPLASVQSPPTKKLEKLERRDNRHFPWKLFSPMGFFRPPAPQPQPPPEPALAVQLEAKPPTNPTFVYSHLTKKTHRIETDSEVLQLAVGSAAGANYVVLVTRNAVELHEITPEGVHLRRRIPGSFTKQSQILNAEGIAVLAVATDGHLSVFHPLASAQAEATWVLPDDMKALVSHLRPNGQILIAGFFGEGDSTMLRIFDTRREEVGRISAPDAEPSGTLWHESDLGEPMFFVRTGPARQPNPLRILKPLKGSGDLKFEEFTSVFAAVNSPPVYFIHRPEDGRELMVIPTATRDAIHAFPMIEIYDLETRRSVALLTVSNSVEYLFQVPSSGEILALGILHGRAKIFNLFTNELRYETFLFGQTLLPLARDEHGREILALSSGSLSDAHLAFFGLTDSARSP